MKPRVLAVPVAAILLLSAGPAYPSPAHERGASPRATATPGVQDEGDAESPRRHIHLSRDRASQVTISDEADVPAGTVHHDDIVAIFGSVRVAGEVTGDVVVVMGSIEITGKVDGEVVGIMSATRLSDQAEIDGDLVMVGGPLERAPGARIGGETVNLNFLQAVPFLRHGFTWHALFWFCFLLKLAKLAGLFLVVLLIAALVPRRLSLVATAFPSRWGMAILAGLLSYCAAVVLCFVLFATLIGIPLALALALTVKLIKWIGVASILYLLGHTIGRNVLKRELSHFAAVLGGFAVYAVIYLVPIFGGLFAGAVSVLGLGIAVLTRFGSEEPWRKQGPQTPPATVPPPAPGTGTPPAYAPGTGGS